jgi:lia operon protein LiaG
MTLEVAVPANVTVDAGSVSGDISMTGVHGDVTAGSVSGDITMDHLHASSVHASTVSGDVDVRVDELTGSGDLKFNSVSGDVTLEVPREFGADLSMATVSGDINSDFPITLGNGRMSRRALNARIGSGGRRLDVSTVSGDLKLRMSK